MGAFFRGQPAFCGMSDTFSATYSPGRCSPPGKSIRGKQTLLPIAQLRQRDRRSGGNGRAIFQRNLPRTLQRLGAEALQVLLQRLLRLLQLSNANVRQLMMHLQQEFIV